MLAVGSEPFSRKNVVPSDSGCFDGALPGGPEPPASDRIPQMGNAPHDAFTREGLSPSYFCLNDDARTSVRWADAGLGVGIVPASSQPLLQNPHTKVYKISDSRLFTSISVIHNKNAYLSTIARMFLKHLITEMH